MKLTSPQPAFDEPAANACVVEVERAISDVRRGQSVKLMDSDANALLISSGEHYPGREFISGHGHPAVMLMKYAGLLPRAVIEPAGESQAALLSVHAEAIRRYPQALAASLVKVSEADVPLEGSEQAHITAFRPRFGHEEHLAVVIGDPTSVPAPYARIHSSCVTGDVFGSLRCDCGNQLRKSVRTIAESGGGVIIYLSQEGRGIGIANKLRAYQLQDKGMDTVEANEALGFEPDERNYALAARIFELLNLRRITLLTNNPSKIEAMQKLGIEVAGRVPLITELNTHNEEYIKTKVQKMAHQF